MLLYVLFEGPQTWHAAGQRDKSIQLSRCVCCEAINRLWRCAFHDFLRFLTAGGVSVVLRDLFFSGFDFFRPLTVGLPAVNKQNKFVADFFR